MVIRDLDNRRDRQHDDILPSGAVRTVRRFSTMGIDTDTRLFGVTAMAEPILWARRAPLTARLFGIFIKVQTDRDAPLLGRRAPGDLAKSSDILNGEEISEFEVKF